MTEEALVERLLALGCHQTDIGDAFEAADPGWATRGDVPIHADVAIRR